MSHGDIRGGGLVTFCLSAHPKQVLMVFYVFESFLMVFHVFQMMLFHCFLCHQKKSKTSPQTACATCAAGAIGGAVGAAVLAAWDSLRRLSAGPTVYGNSLERKKKLVLLAFPKQFTVGFSLRKQT